MQHLTFSATLAEQHRQELFRQADQARLVHSSRPVRARHWRAALRRPRLASQAART
jgi:hypothetical protein